VGHWQIRHDTQSGWQRIAVPGCWEGTGLPAADPGPYWYRSELPIPSLAPDRRLWLSLGAVSYRCTVWVNGQKVGDHAGMWDPFEVDVA
jgi:beta-galactosidase/beta-glucuronidase